MRLLGVDARPRWRFYPDLSGDSLATYQPDNLNIIGLVLARSCFASQRSGSSCFSPVDGDRQLALVAATEFAIREVSAGGRDCDQAGDFRAYFAGHR